MLLMKAVYIIAVAVGTVFRDQHTTCQRMASKLLILPTTVVQETQVDVSVKNIALFSSVSYFLLLCESACVCYTLSPHLLTPLINEQVERRFRR